MKAINPADFSFERIIQSNTLYVDKTEYIWKLVNSDFSSYFLSRPRRFGKSLTISTLEAFFLGKRELFKGLAIDRLAPEDIWQEWPVIRLDMSDTYISQNKETLFRGIVLSLQAVADQYGITLKEDIPQFCFQELILALHKKTGKKVVILIDEYDHPILDNLQTPFVHEVVNFMSGFYRVLKSNNAIERFVFVTGVSKFAHTSLFSGANNIVDLTQKEAFSTMLGYTEKELHDNFSEYIEEASQRLSLSKDEVLTKLKNMYDGFCFHPNAENVYNPVSIGCFFNDYEFNNYWCETGNPRFLIDLIKNKPFQLNNVTEKWMSAKGFTKFDITDINPIDVALQTGYLTIKETKMEAGEKLVRYDFPNTEIRDTWNTVIMGMVMKLGKDEVEEEKVILRRLLNNADVDGFMKHLQNLMGGIPYENTKSDDPEGVFRNYLHVIFTLLNLPFQAEVQQASGKVDLVARTREAAFAFELKLVDDDQKKDKAIEAALEQAREKKYAEPYLNTSAVVKRIGIVFNSVTRQLVGWKAEDVK